MAFSSEINNPHQLVCVHMGMTLCFVLSLCCSSHNKCSLFYLKLVFVFSPSAVELAMIMDRLYGGVCYAGIDTDPELKYPKGAGRVAFSNQQSYIAAISARFVQLQHGEIDKRVSGRRKESSVFFRLPSLFHLSPHTSLPVFFCLRLSSPLPCFWAVQNRMCYKFYRVFSKENWEFIY